MNGSLSKQTLGFIIIRLGSFGFNHSNSLAIGLYYNALDNITYSRVLLIVRIYAEFEPSLKHFSGFFRPRMSYHEYQFTVFKILRGRQFFFLVSLYRGCLFQFLFLFSGILRGAACGACGGGNGPCRSTSREQRSPKKKKKRRSLI